MIVIFHAVPRLLLFLVSERWRTGSTPRHGELRHAPDPDAAGERLALPASRGMFIRAVRNRRAKWTAIPRLPRGPRLRGRTFLIIMAFGSSLTIFYWASSSSDPLRCGSIGSRTERSVEDRVTRYEWFSEIALAVGVIGITAGIGWISDHVVGPYALAAFSATPRVFPQSQSRHDHRDASRRASSSPRSHSGHRSARTTTSPTSTRAGARRTPAT